MTKFRDREGVTGVEERAEIGKAMYKVQVYTGY